MSDTLFAVWLGMRSTAGNDGVETGGTKSICGIRIDISQNKRLEQNCQLNVYHRAFLTVSGHDSHLWDDVCRVHDHIDCCSSRIPATFCANSSAIMFRGDSYPFMS